MTYEEIRQNEAVNTYIRQADAALATLGFTEHSFAHVTLVAEKSRLYSANTWLSGTHCGTGQDCRLSA